MKTFLERLALSAFEGIVKEADNLIQEVRKDLKDSTKTVEPIQVEVTRICRDCGRKQGQKAIAYCSTCRDFNP